jgi:hypothetical protein
MDPYLESPDWFPNLHADLIFCIKEALRTRLPAFYYTQSNLRVWLEYSRRYVEPDVEVVRSGRQPRRRRSRGGVAVAEPPSSEPLIVSVEIVEHGPFQESFIEIRRRRGRDVRLVASIEVLSPSNKTLGNPGRQQYLNKQSEILDGEVHLIEIDLLRGGTHTSAVPRDLAEAKAGSFEYHVSVHRFDRPNDYLLYPIQLAQRLPVIAIPLLPSDLEIALDLQAVFDRAYDAGPYANEVDYGRDPIVPRLRPDQAKWAAARIKTRR